MQAATVKTELMINFNLQALDKLADPQWTEPELKWEDDEPPLLPQLESTPAPAAAHSCLDQQLPSASTTSRQESTGESDDESPDPDDSAESPGAAAANKRQCRR